MTVQTYKLINRSEISLLLERMTNASQLFVARIAVNEGDAQCTWKALDRPGSVAAHQYEWIVGRRSGEAWLGMGLTADSVRGFAHTVLGDTPGAALDEGGLIAMRELADRFMEELGESLIASLRGASVEDQGELRWDRQQPVLGKSIEGEAYAAIECQLGDRLRLMLVLWPVAVLSCLVAAPVTPRDAVPLEPRKSALQPQKIRLEVIVGEAEMPVHDLTTLKVGDVIKLDRKLEQPLQIQVREGKAVGAVFLGMRNGHAAVQFSAGRNVHSSYSRSAE